MGQAWGDRAWGAGHTQDRWGVPVERGPGVHLRLSVRSRMDAAVSVRRQGSDRSLGWKIDLGHTRQTGAEV